MRTPTYLSYSSVSMFEKTPDEFFLKYLAENRPGRLPQTEPMSVGSSFDAYVKANLHARLFGEGADAEYEFDALFTSQVDEPNRDFALKAGEYCFEQYKESWAYDALLFLLKQSIEPPRFECSLTGTIGGAPFLGKPDCRFVLDLGSGRISIVFDWKVKGFCSKYATSPSKGYVLCRDAFPGKKSRSHGKAHPMVMEYNFRGLSINRDYMENCNKDYADQCSLYGWLLGEEIGGDSLVFVDELTCKPNGDRPLIRVSNHRARVKPEYQLALEQRVKTCWDAINSGHVFVDMTREENDFHIETLNDVAIGLATDGSDLEAYFNTCTRPQFKR